MLLWLSHAPSLNLLYLKCQKHHDGSGNADNETNGVFGLAVANLCFAFKMSVCKKTMGNCCCETEFWVFKKHF